MNKLTTQEIKALIPTVQLKGEKPITMVWLTQASAIQAMRNVEHAKDVMWESEVERLQTRIDELHERIRVMKATANVKNYPL